MKALAGLAADPCRGVEIRDNEIHAARVKVPAAVPAARGYPLIELDSTMVGVAITLMNSTRLRPPPRMSEAATAGVLEDILVHGNRIVGGEGLGILIQGVSRSRIADNVVTGIRRRTPFPGLTLSSEPSIWQVANGSAIWLSPGSDENEIAGNTFVDIATCAIHLTGDRNVVVTRTVGDEVCDLGADNQVRGPNGSVPRNPLSDHALDGGMPWSHVRASRKPRRPSYRGSSAQILMRRQISMYRRSAQRS